MGAIHAFGGVRGQCPLHGLWLLTCHILNNIVVLRSARGKVWAGHSLWKVRFSRRAWLHFFIFRTRCVVLFLVAVGIHNDFPYLVQRQLTRPFSTWRLTTFHFVNKKNTATTFNSKLSTVFKRLSASQWMENLPVPFTASVRVLGEPKRFYDLNIPLAKCKNNIPVQRILRAYGT